MAQSGYLYEEGGKRKVRYRIKDDSGKWKWAPSHTLGTIRDFPKQSEAKIAMAASMEGQNKIGFKAETAASMVEFVKSTYFPDIESPGIYHLDPSTVKTHRGNWRKHLEPLLQGKMLRTFRPCDAEKVMVEITNKTGNKLAHETYNRVKSLLSGIFTHAKRQGLIDHNPVTDSSVPEGKPFGRKCYAYSLAEIFQHLALFDGATKAIIAVVAAGLREGELRGLWGTDDQGDRLVIRRSVWRSTVKDRCKTALSGSELEPAEVPIIGTLRKILDGVKHGSSWLFPNSNDGAIDLSNLVDRVIRPTLEAAGLQWYGWHAYRRGLATNLKELGVDDMVIQQVLRHGDVGTTRDSYIKIRDSRVEAAMRKLDDACTAFVQSKAASGLVN